MSRVDDGLVGDSDYAHGVVDGIVSGRVVGEGDAAGGDHNAASWDVHGVESYLRPGGGLVFAVHDKFVFIGELAGYNQGGIV